MRKTLQLDISTRFLFLLHQHVTLNPDVTSRKRFYDRVRVTIATVTPRALESRRDRLARFHRRIYRRKTTFRLFFLAFPSTFPEIDISSAFKLIARPSKLCRSSCSFCFAAVTSIFADYLRLLSSSRIWSINATVLWITKESIERQPISTASIFILIRFKRVLLLIKHIEYLKKNNLNIYIYFFFLFALESSCSFSTELLLLSEWH